MNIDIQADNGMLTNTESPLLAPVNGQQAGTVATNNINTNANTEITLYPANFSGVYLVLVDSSQCSDMINDKSHKRLNII